MRGRMVGEAGVVRDAFEQLPILLAALDGPDHRVAAMNAAYRAFTEGSVVIGLPYRDAFPGLAAKPLQEMLDRVYATGLPETRTEWRAQIGPGRPGGLTEVYADFTVVPRRAADGTVNGLLVMATDVTDRVSEQQAAQQQAAGQQAAGQQAAGQQAAGRRRGAQESGGPGSGGGTAGSAAARRPARPAAGQDRGPVPGGRAEQSAGGDWFDAIPLADGSVALIVGDVVGHGVAASAAMGQLRAVLTELLAAEADLGRVLERADAFAARTPALRAATLALAVLDPASGKLRYTTWGHPPPLVIGTDGAARYLEGTGTGPLGTGSPPVLAISVLAPGELVLLYSDGLVERPDRTLDEGMAELAAAAAGAAAEQAPAFAADPAAERVCRRSVELLTRTGRADDVTALAAQRLAHPVPALRLELPSERPSLTTTRDAFAGWLSLLDVAADDADALHLALVEVFTNAIEHAYPRGQPGIIELEARLGDDGNVECRVTDHGSWRQPDPADADRGHGPTSPPPISWPGGCFPSAGAARSRSSPTSPASPSSPARAFARCTRSAGRWRPMART